MTTAPGPSSPPALEIEDLWVNYGSVPAVRQLALTVGAGEIVGLIGPNGAGKSTTLHTIVGLVPARSGDIRVHGTSILGRKPETIARGGVSLVPEGRRIFAELTVEENLRLGLVARRDRTDAGSELEWIDELFPIVHEFRARQAGTLSGGQHDQLAVREVDQPQHAEHESDPDRDQGVEGADPDRIDERLDVDHEAM